MNQLIYSEKDSKRFGLVIYRMQADEINASEILEQIIEHNMDTAIIRLPTIKIAQTSQLIRMAIPFLITDTLAYYQLDLQKATPAQIKNKDLSFSIAGLKDQQVLNHLAASIFGQYINHYRNNPMFDNESVNEGYKDWVKSYAEKQEDRVCWLIRRAEKVIGFGTFNFESQKQRIVKGILYGVKKEERRKGVFKDLMSHTISYSKDKGLKKMQTIAQIENIYAQRVWTNMGFELVRSANTIHVNAALSKSVFERFTVSHIIEQKDAEAMKVTNRHILRQINFHFDIKQNMVTQNHKFVNIRPLKVDKEYLLNFSFPSANKGLLRVTDEERKNYMLVYFYLKHFVA